MAIFKLILEIMRSLIFAPLEKSWEKVGHGFWEFDVHGATSYLQCNCQRMRWTGIAV